MALDPPPLEVWAGLECTFNRVEGRYFDQLIRSGHYLRPGDLELFGQLGVKALRYPLIWERIAPEPDRSPDWNWADGQMAALRRLGVNPIVGLVHHGGGPPRTSLLDESFVTGLETFAESVARRYPWLTDFTPVNEPLTTARFSALYGYWHPHRTDLRSFVRALVIQCRGVLAAMAAIRRVIPAARLVQTEDCGRVFSTPPLAHQAEYENLRRFLSLDLLCGRVDRHHPLWRHLVDAGASETELLSFQDTPGPDIIGVNYYLTSDRFLDHRLERYPAALHGGNGREAYVDVEAVRVRREGMVGHRSVLQEVWERYGRPVAITEVQADCTREDQLRWLDEAWAGALDARRDGVDVRAVTAWSLLGTWDWDRQVRDEAGHYEPGVFDITGGTPRPTALARMIRGLATQARARHPVLTGQGWWRRSERLWAGGSAPDVPRISRDVADEPARPLLITGGGGHLATAFEAACRARGLEYRLLRREMLDVADGKGLAAALDDLHPWAVINAAGFARVDEAEAERDLCHRTNTLGPATLARACAERGLQLLTFSSDLVFDGARRHPYVESCNVAPLNVYGETQARADAEVASLLPEALIIRTSALFSPVGNGGFLGALLACASSGRLMPAAEDIFVSPTYLPDLVKTALDLLIDGERGLWHLANQGCASWAEFGREAARLVGLDSRLVRPLPAADLRLVARRPSYSVLGSERGALLPPLGPSLAHWANARRTLQPGIFPSADAR